MSDKSMKQLLKGAFILTFAAFLSKILSAVYRVPFQNFVGDLGFYVYQQAYPFYGVAMTLALTGFPQFLSKFLAESPNDLEKQKKAAKIFPLLVILSFTMAIGLLLLSPLLARWMGNERLTGVLMVSACTFFLVPLLSIYRGAYQSELAMLASGVSQVYEQLIRVLIIGVLMVSACTFFLVPLLSIYRGAYQSELAMLASGVSQVYEQLIRVLIIILAALGFSHGYFDVYQTAQWAMTGSVVGGIIALCILKKYQKQQLSWLHFAWPTVAQIKELFRTERYLLSRLLIEGGLLTLYTGLLIVFQLVDSFTVANGLHQAGLSMLDAQNLKGIYDRGQPFVQLGLVVSTALSACFLPNLTRYQMQEKEFSHLRSSKMYLRLIATLASAATVGLILILPLMNKALFKDALGSSALSIFAIAIFMMSMIQSYQAIEQSKNHFRPAFYAVIGAIVLKMILSYPLTIFFSINGASLSTILALGYALGYFMLKTSRAVNGFWKEDKFVLKLGVCLLVMSVGLVGYLQLLPTDLSRLASLAVCILGVIIGATLFLVTAVKVRLLTIREWLLLPKGKQILVLMRGKK